VNSLPDGQPLVYLIVFDIV